MADDPSVLDSPAEAVRRGAFDAELSIQAVSPMTWRLLRPLVWNGTQGDTFTVPVGFETDFATVPRFLHWLWLPYGAYTRAAVLHDYLLTDLAQWQKVHPPHGRETWDGSLPLATSREIDGIFRRVMQDLGVRWLKRWTGWTAVRWASLFNPRRAYGRGFARDLPRLIPMTLLVGPVIAVGAVPVVVVLLIVRLANAALSWLH